MTENLSYTAKTNDFYIFLTVKRQRKTEHQRQIYGKQYLSTVYIKIDKVCHNHMLIMVNTGSLCFKRNRSSKEIIYI